MTAPIPQSTTLSSRNFALFLNRIIHAFAKHWLLLFNVIIGLYVWLPWLAPLFMKLGWESAANAIYIFYSTQCHQLPERSFFLFGDKFMYSLAEVQAAWRNTNNPLILRQFIGSETMGWKVAWSDRMVSMYTTIFLSACCMAYFANGCARYRSGHSHCLQCQWRLMAALTSSAIWQA